MTRSTSASVGSARRAARAFGVLWRARDRGAGCWLALATLAVLVGGLSAGLGPLALKRVVDGLSSSAHGAEVPVLLGLYAAALAIQRVCEQAQAYTYGCGEQRLTRRLSVLAFEHMLRLRMASHLETPSSALARSLSEGVQGIRLILAHAITSVGPVLVQLVVAAIVVFSEFDTASRWVLLGGMIAYTSVYAWGVAYTAGPIRAFFASQMDAGGVVADGLMNVEAIKSFTAEGRFSARYDRVLAESGRAWRTYLDRRFGNGLAVATVFAVVLGGTLALASAAIAQHRLSLGGFVLLNAYILQLVRPLEMLGFAARDMGQGLAQLEHLIAVFEKPVEAPAPLAQPPPSPAGGAELLFEAVGFAYRPDRRTLEHVTFRVPPGSVVAIVGPSGAGKSSLLRLILRLYEPNEGRIRLDGRPIDEMSIAELRGQIAVVSQDTILFDDSISENIALAADEADEASVRRAAETARLTDLLAQLPEGLATRVGERGLKLSGGERQRVSIARATLRRARLVLFDEATAALDPATEASLWRSVEQLGRQVTRVIVTHRLSSVVAADEILVLDGGRIVERGRHAQLVRVGGTYARLWRSQSRRVGDPAIPQHAAE